MFKCKCESVSVQVYVSKCQCSSASVEVSVCKCKCRSVSVQGIFRKNPSQCFREKNYHVSWPSSLECTRDARTVCTIMHIYVHANESKPPSWTRPGAADGDADRRCGGGAMATWVHALEGGIARSYVRSFLLLVVMPFVPFVASMSPENHGFL